MGSREGLGPSGKPWGCRWALCVCGKHCVCKAEPVENLFAKTPNPGAFPQPRGALALKWSAPNHSGPSTVTPTVPRACWAFRAEATPSLEPGERECHCLQ